MSAAMKLNACPFCGSDNLHHSSNGHENNFIVCTNCGAEGPANTNDSKAAISWNRRTPPQGELSALPELPELPDDPAGVCEVYVGKFEAYGVVVDRIECADGYSADQMRAYGLLCRQSGDAADKRDAERYRWLRNQHESDAAEAFCVFHDDAKNKSLEPVGSMPGELDEAIDAAIAQRQEGGE